MLHGTPDDGARNGWSTGDMLARLLVRASLFAALGVTASPAVAAPVAVRTAMAEYDTDLVAYVWTEVHVRAGAEADAFTVSGAPGGVTIREPTARFRILPPSPSDWEDLVKRCVSSGLHEIFCPLRSPGDFGDTEIKTPRAAGRVAASQSLPPERNGERRLHDAAA